MDKAILVDLGFKKENYNTLSDPNVSISYSDAIEVLDDLQSIIGTKLAVDQEQCVAFFCKNQVLDVLILAFLIAKKQSFILLNGNNKIIKESELQYCSFLLSTDNLTKDFGFSELKKNMHLRPNKYFKPIKSNAIKKGTVLFKSSGSTGDSKIVVHNRNILINNSLECLQHLDINSDARVAIPVPLYHMYGFGAGLLPSLLKGVSLILVNNTNILVYLDAERLFNPNVVFMTPGILEMYVKFKRNQYSYKYIISAGDRVNNDTAAIVNTKFGKLINLYGSTELGVIATSKNTAENDYNLLLPLNNVKISSIPLDENFKELLCDHPNPFMGYYNVNKRVFEEIKSNCRAFNTHDLVIEYDDKKFKLNGRRNLCLNRNGVLVSLTEIEQQIKNHIKEINEIVIFQTKETNTYKGCVICACFVLNKGQKLSENELRIKCKTFLESYKIPDSFIEKDYLPYLQSGKPDRQRIKSTYILNL